MRTPEQGHTKKCLARAIICAVENIRDAADSDVDFVLAMQSENIVATATDYFDGLLDCICPTAATKVQTRTGVVHVAKTVRHYGRVVDAPACSGVRNLHAAWPVADDTPVTCARCANR